MNNSLKKQSIGCKAVLLIIALLAALGLSLVICGTVRQGTLTASFRAAVMKNGFTTGERDVPVSSTQKYSLEQAKNHAISLNDVEIEGSAYHSKSNENWIEFDTGAENLEIVSLTILVDKIETENATLTGAVYLHGEEQYAEEDSVHFRLHEGENFVELYQGAGTRIRLHVADAPATVTISEITLEQSQRHEWISMGAMLNFILLSALLFLGFAAALIPSISKRVSRFVSPFVQSIKAMGSFMADNRRMVLATSITAIAAFGYEICNFTLSIDEERVMAYAKDTLVWAKEGRTGIAFIKQAFMENGMFPPFFSTMVSVLLWVISAFLWCQLMENASQIQASKFTNWLFCGIWCTFPIVIPEFIIYNTYNIEVSAGMFCLTMSLMILQRAPEKKRGLSIVWSILLLAFSLSIYQSYAAVFVTGTIICVLLSLTSNGCDFGKLAANVGIHIAVFIGGLATYWLEFAVVKRAFHLETGYTQQFSGWDAEGTFAEKLLNSLRGLKNTFFSFETTGMNFVFLALLAITVSAVISIMVFHGWKKIAAPILLGLLILAPFALWIGLLSPFLPPRTIQALPLMAAFAWYYLMRLLEKIPRARILSFVCATLAVVTVIYQTQTLNCLFYGDHLRYEQDKQTALRLIDDIEDHIGREIDKPIEFIGRRNLQGNDLIPKIEVLGNVMGASYWEWNDGDSVERIAGLYYALGYSYRFVDSTPEDTEHYQNILRVWPEDDSILEEPNRVIVRLR